MPPLNPLSGCLNCDCLSQKITELEGRISLLHQIKEDEELIDSLVAASTNATVGVENFTSLCPAATASSQAEDPWHQLGAKPRALVSSTPHQPWTAAPARKRRGRNRAHPAQPWVLPTDNMFITLDDLDDTSLAGFPPLPPPASLTAARPSSPVTRQVVISTKPRPTPGQSFPQAATDSRISAPRPTPPVRAAAPPRRHNPPAPPPPPPPPTSLIIGDSIVRYVKDRSAVTHCFPGAKVPDILEQIPNLLADYPHVKKVVVHVGTNDTANQQSELLKRDFIHLFNSLKVCGKQVFISGPIPPLGRGVGRFSRVLSLHTWLQSECCSHNLMFIDNFNLFWERSSFFSRDGLHPSVLGARKLSANIFHSVHIAPCA